IRFLREFSNYLTPRTGLLGADTWTMVSTWLRNTVLNQLVLIASLSAVLLLPRLVGAIGNSSMNLLLALAVGGFGVACYAIGDNLRLFGRDASAESGDGQGGVQAMVVIPLFVCVVALACAAARMTTPGEWTRTVTHSALVWLSRRLPSQAAWVPWVL